MPVSDRVIGGGRGSLFGGCGLAAGVVALEGSADRPVVWATGQYLSTVGVGSQLSFDVAFPAMGRSMAQGRTIGRVDDHEIISVVGALGRRREEIAGVWREARPAPGPNESDPLVRHFEAACIHDHVEVRVAKGMFGFSGQGEPSADGELVLWLRMPEVDHDAAALALMADYMSAAVGNAAGVPSRCTSLDNTIRFASRDYDRNGWVRCDADITYAGDGVAYGHCHMWSEAGMLLATASQSMTVGFMQEEDRK